MEFFLRILKWYCGLKAVQPVSILVHFDLDSALGGSLVSRSRPRRFKGFTPPPEPPQFHIPHFSAGSAHAAHGALKIYINTTSE